MTTRRGKGRPTVFTPAMLEKILRIIAEDGIPERAIFRQEGMPEWSSWTKYKRNHPEFIPQYTCAKADGCEVWEEHIYNVAHDESRDLQPDGKGSVKSDNTAVNRDRLKIDTVWKLMRSTEPRKYGDKVQQELTGADGKDLIPALKLIFEK